MNACVENHYLSAARHRRGVLLLIVLSMLTLFLMLGAAYLLTTTRAWETSKAYARLTLGAPDNRIPHAQLIDRVMLQVLRGGTTVRSGGVQLGTLTSGSIESLLADKYGLETISGTMMSCNPIIISSTAQPLITGQLSTGTTLRPTDLVGRVLTFDAPGRPTASFRILRSGPNGFIGNEPTTVFDVTAIAVAESMPFVLPRPNSTVLINGREFSGDGESTSPNEPWDGFDKNNDFLASLAPTNNPTVATVSRGSYLNTTSSSFTLASGTYSLASGTLTLVQDPDNDGAPDFADNDNDGVVDGAFVDFGLPDVIDRNGVATQLRASVLVVPLDGRINMNLHGSYDQIIYGTSNFTWPTQVASGSVPLGSGYGPAEVDLTQFVLTGTQAGERPFLLSLAGGTSNDLLGMRPNGMSRFWSGNTYRLTSAGGRFGEVAGSGTSGPRPGTTGTNDAYSRIVDQGVSGTGSPDLNYGVPPQWWNGSSTSLTTRSGTTIFNSPPDLHGRMKTLTGTASGSGLVPHLQFVKPDWGPNDGEIRDDPFETRIDTRRGFGGSFVASPSVTSGTAIDNPFTPAELEGVLRPYDFDARQRAPRLTAILGSAVEGLRTEVTSDAWDTTAIVGGPNGAAGRIFGSGTVRGWLTGIQATGTLTGTNALTGILGGEVARGERFNLSRPFAASGTAALTYSNTSAYYYQRQAYFKDLYTLLVMLQTGTNSSPPTSPSVDAIAQWAANVVEFRDADSVMTPFEYDVNPQNGWASDGNVMTDEGGDRRVVWGAERPEILIRETFAWENQPQNNRGMLIGLHRPWKATAYSPVTSIAAEPCDPLLEQNFSAPTNRVDLTKKCGDDAASYPIWRLRIVDSATTHYVRFDTLPSGVGSLGVDSDFAIITGTTILTGSSPTTGTAFLNMSGVSTGTVPTVSLASSGTAYLERISDPSQPLPTASGSSTWNANPLTTGSTGTNALRYVVVDAMPLTTFQTNTIAAGGSGTATTFARSTSGPNDAFWKTATTGSDAATVPFNGSVTGVPRSLSAGATQWFPWANRPFVSAAELLLVPQQNAYEMLQNYAVLSGTNQQTHGCPLTNLEWLFDSVHVPSRYAGVNPVTTNDLSQDTGVWPLTPSLSQFSNYREPGRVNLNVVTSTNVWNAVVAGALQQPVRSATAANLGIKSGLNSPAPAKSLFKLLTLSQTSTAVVSDTTTTTTTGSQAPLAQDVLAWNRNPTHTFYTATRLADTVTPRSNVFAVWITLRESVQNDPDSVRLHRGFYIIDRSIPVGFKPGEDYNVMDCVRLRRIIE